MRVSIQVFFAVLIGAFSLGQAAPNLENLLTAAGAAGTIFETIDRVRSRTAEFSVCQAVCNLSQSVTVLLYAPPGPAY